MRQSFSGIGTVEIDFVSFSPDGGRGVGTSGSVFRSPGGRLQIVGYARTGALLVTTLTTARSTSIGENFAALHPDFLPRPGVPVRVTYVEPHAVGCACDAAAAGRCDRGEKAKARHQVADARRPAGARAVASSATLNFGDTPERAGAREVRLEVLFARRGALALDKVPQQVLVAERLEGTQSRDGSSGVSLFEGACGLGARSV